MKSKRIVDPKDPFYAFAIKKICSNHDCKKPFRTFNEEVLYCSESCKGKVNDKKRRILETPEHKTERLKKLSERELGEKNPSWKGDNVGVKAMHSYLRKHKTKSLFCEYCGIKEGTILPNGTIVRLDLVNISLDGKYYRNADFFRWMCRKCHTNLDDRVKLNLKHNHRKPETKSLEELSKLTEQRLKSLYLSYG
jgi:uncharacterized protein YlaI